MELLLPVGEPLELILEVHLGLGVVVAEFREDAVLLLPFIAEEAEEVIGDGDCRSGRAGNRSGW